MLTIRLIDNHDEVLWDGFVQRCPGGTFFHQWPWLDALRTWMPDQDIWILGCFDGERLVGGCTLRSVRHPLARQAIKPWNTHYCGFLAERTDADGARQIISALLQHLRRFHHFSLTLAPGFSLDDLSSDADLEFFERRTLVFFSADETTMWKNITSDSRNQIRRAMRGGVRVENTEDVSILRRLYWESYKRQGVSIHFRPEAFEAICRQLIASGRAMLKVAFKPDGQPCAALLFGWDSRQAFGLLNGSDLEQCRSGAGSLLWWEMLRELAPRFEAIDFVGEGSPGIRRFKMQFNPRERIFHELRGYGGGFSKRRFQAWRLLKALKAAQSAKGRS